MASGSEFDDIPEPVDFQNGLDLLREDGLTSAQESAAERKRQSDRRFRLALYGLTGLGLVTAAVVTGAIIYSQIPSGDFQPTGTGTATPAITITVTREQMTPTLFLSPQVVAVLPSETPTAVVTEDSQAAGGGDGPDPEGTPTDDPTPTIEQPTGTATLTSTVGVTPTPTEAFTQTAAPTLTETQTNTPTITYTPTFTLSPTFTPTPTFTASPTLRPTDTLTPVPTSVNIDLLPTGDTVIDNLEIQIAGEIFRHDDLNPNGTEWGKWFPGITYPVLDPAMNPEMFSGVLDLQTRSFQIMALADTDPAKAGLVAAFNTDFRNLWASFGPAGHRPLSIDRIMTQIYGIPADGIAAVDNMIARQQEILRENFSGFSDTEFQSAMTVTAQGFAAIQSGDTSLPNTDGTGVRIFLNPTTDMPELFNTNPGDSMVFDSAPLAAGEVREEPSVRINAITGTDAAVFAARNYDQNRYLASGSTGRSGLAGIVDRLGQPWTWIKSAVWGTPDVPPRADNVLGQDSGWVYTVEVYFTDDFGDIAYNRVILSQDDGDTFYPGAVYRTTNLVATATLGAVEAQPTEDNGGETNQPPSTNQPGATDVPVQPTDAPVLPTDVPVIPTDAPVLPTDAPVMPTDVTP